jgi:hypothetical protein
MNQDDIRLNGEFFAPRRAVFDHINEGEELADEPSARLIRAQRTVAYQGFWRRWTPRRTRSCSIEWKRRACGHGCRGRSSRSAGFT